MDCLYCLGICGEDCPIPPKYCGQPIRTGRLPDDQDNNVDIIQLPWMVSLGVFESNELRSEFEEDPRDDPRDQGDPRDDPRDRDGISEIRSGNIDSGTKSVNR